MTKIFRKLIVSGLLCLFLILSISLVVAQTTPSPQGSQSEGVPVVLGDQTLFYIQAPQGGLSVQTRAERISQNLQSFANNYSLPLEELEIYQGDNDGIPLSSITTANKLLMKISNQDAQLAGKSRSQLAQDYFQKIKDAVIRYRQERRFDYLLAATLRSVLATGILILILLIIHNLFTQFYRGLRAWEETYIKPVRLGNWELIGPNQLDNVITFFVRLFQVSIILGILLTYFSFVFRQFPWTRRLSKVIEGHLLATLTRAWQGFLNYLPNLFMILLIIFIARYLVSLAKSFFRELEEENISIPGFYAEWARPTYRLVSFLIFALATVVAFPFLPGFDSPAFQGISVFLGILFSLGSTAVISNLVSGSVLIYTRAFRIGDHVKIGNVYGKVLEKTLLVTRVLTSKNIVVSIPNAQISTSSIENYSFAYRELNKPLMIRTPVYLGYEVAWEDAYPVLIEAAKSTPGMIQYPEPFIMQEELNEVYVTYQVSVYIDEDYFRGKTLQEFEQARSQLHENIRSYCAQAGIRIFAPRYEADPNTYGPAKP